MEPHDPPSIPAPNPAPGKAIVGTIGRPFQPGYDPRRNTEAVKGSGRPRSEVRALARQAFHKTRPFALLMQMARTAPRERDRLEALKMLALLGYTQTIFTGQQASGAALPPGDILPEEDAVQFYLPGNARDDAAGERSA